jgi:hypothetical protein
MIAPLQYTQVVAEAGGRIAGDFHRWLQIIARTISSTYVADKAPGRSFVIGTDQFGVHAEELILLGTEEITAEGDGILVVV